MGDARAANGGLYRFLAARRQCVSLTFFDAELGRTHLTTHEIDMGDAKPIKLPLQRIPLHLQQEVTDHLKQMLDSGNIQPSSSPWAANVLSLCKRKKVDVLC